MRPSGLDIKTVCQPHHRLLLLPHLPHLPPLRHSIHRQLQHSIYSTKPINMPTYIVTCKEDATPEQFQAAKKHAEEQGGKIGHEYSLIKGFSVEFPEDQISTLEKHEHVKHVEKDQEVRTQ
ncbi:peptidase inhibitor I9 [Colletotrichum truncatum]|uniref:Peptidase inhibitor I9 n=1 Tax=Colletotrichum truncatum TaxID=5467 RepID=A0ACC3YME0_COLTU|nr:peptidase inhibitor I9 [Colletotrichum truncatum]KAF6792271.1 peptidase inhibitor I9 [Colletotrichum truncatum]